MTKQGRFKPHNPSSRLCPLSKSAQHNLHCVIQSSKDITVGRKPELEVVNTTKQVAELIDLLAIINSEWRYVPTVYIDLEGVNLSREGSISIFTLLVDFGAPRTFVKLIDVFTLGHLAFDTTGHNNKTLKNILEDAKIPKVFFDVRSDSDALFAHYGIAMQGVEDVQLFESATRKTTESRRFLSGLNKCVTDNSAHLLDIDRTSWILAKNEGERLFKAERGGSYEVFNRRPIPKAIMDYCAGDVQCLPGLYKKFRDGAARWQLLVKEASQKRVTDSQKSDYQPHGQHRALAPWSAEQNKLLDEWNYSAHAWTGGYFDNDFDFHDDLMDQEMDDDYDNDYWDIDDGHDDYEDWTRAPWQGSPS